MATDTYNQPEVAPAPRRVGWHLRAATVSPWVRDRARLLARVLTFCTYSVVVATVATRHERWFDEAQAWLLARDASLWHLLSTQLRYEGHPGLWHLLLVGPAKLGLPYATITVISVTIAIIGAAVLVRRGPFPLLLTPALLFSFVIGYQYAVVARSYVLFPLLLWLLAITWRRHLTAPWPFVIVLSLLANVTVHGMLIAGSVFAVHLVELWRPPPQLTGIVGTPQMRRAQLAAGAVFAGVCMLLVVQLWPASDQSVGGGVNPDLLNLLNVGPRLLNSALTGNPLASLLAVALTAWWFRRTRTLFLWALPTVVLLVLGAMKYHNYWHDGILFLVWVFALWASLERGPVTPTATQGWSAWADRWARLAAYAGLAGVLMVQGVWWWQTAEYDFNRSYSGAPALAAWLEEQDLDDTEVWALGFHTLGALPYLDENVYDNNNGGRPPAYMHWSTNSRLIEDPWTVWLAHPDLIVWSLKSTRILVQPAFHGYERVMTFEGQMFWKNRAIERDAFAIFRPER